MNKTYCTVELSHSVAISLVVSYNEKIGHDSPSERAVYKNAFLANVEELRKDIRHLIQNYDMGCFEEFDEDTYELDTYDEEVIQ